MSPQAFPNIPQTISAKSGWTLRGPAPRIRWNSFGGHYRGTTLHYSTWPPPRADLYAAMTPDRSLICPTGPRRTLPEEERLAEAGRSSTTQAKARGEHCSDGKASSENHLFDPDDGSSLMNRGKQPPARKTVEDMKAASGPRVSPVESSLAARLPTAAEKGKFPAWRADSPDPPTWRRRSLSSTPSPVRGQVCPMRNWSSYSPPAITMYMCAVP